VDTIQVHLAGERLHIREGEEEFVPKYGLETDFQYFDLDSLIRLYGRKEVETFIQGRGSRRED